MFVEIKELIEGNGERFWLCKSEIDCFFGIEGCINKSNRIENRGKSENFIFNEIEE